MADKKAERLINLTIALLATKRFMKKNEIFSKVAGYSGSAESMDRMFERDKNELRSLGIEITVGDIDPLFDDEPGYRIYKDAYGFQLKDLDKQDLALLSIAAKLWNDSVFGIEAQSSLIKLESFGDLEVEDEPLTFNYRYEDPAANLPDLEGAILESRKISFVYKDGESKRTIDPYRIFIWNGFWYLIGLDEEKKAIRSFKISRISGEIEVLKSTFKPPANFNISEHLPSESRFEVTVLIYENKGAVLRNSGEFISSETNGDLFRLRFTDSETAKREILRNSLYCEVIEPKQLRESVRDHLERLANV
jgi:proteasome accessory factor B